MGFPVGVPRPVVKTTTCAPPPTMPVTDSMSRPGVSITVRPFCVIGADRRRRPRAARPRHPCVSPRAISLHRGQPAADVAGRRLRAADIQAQRPRLGFDAGNDLKQLRGRRGTRRARRQQVFRAHDFGDLAEHAVPPSATRRWVTRPSVGFEASRRVVRPLHLSESTSSDASHHSRVAPPSASANGCAIAMPFSVVRTVPPSD